MLDDMNDLSQHRSSVDFLNFYKYHTSRNYNLLVGVYIHYDEKIHSRRDDVTSK
jgi:hypothetical protein